VPHTGNYWIGEVARRNIAATKSSRLVSRPACGLRGRSLDWSRGATRWRGSLSRGSRLLPRRSRLAGRDFALGCKKRRYPRRQTQHADSSKQRKLFHCGTPQTRRRNAHLAATRSPKGTLITKGPSCILRGVKRPRYLHGCGISASWQNFQPLRVQTFVWQMKSTQP
jgi:hypothetical protein